MSIMHEPIIGQSYFPVCLECDWEGQRTPFETDALLALDRHLAGSHRCVWGLLKRNRALEKIASIAFELVPDEEALLCEHSDDDYYCHGCIGDRVDGEHSDGCRSVKLVELRKELGKL